MGIFVAWISANWFSCLQTVGIIGALVFNGYSILSTSRIRKVDTLINITQQHRAIWLKYFDSPSLKRVNNPKVDLAKHPMTEDEALFVNLVILHLTTVLVAVRKGVFPKPDGFDIDIGDFFRLPIPRAAWNRNKIFRDPETIRFVERLFEDQINK